MTEPERPRTRTIITTVTETYDGRFDYEVSEPGVFGGTKGSNGSARDIGEAVAKLSARVLFLPETRERAFARMVSDLDRCKHGRHEGDVCAGCGGPSKGNLPAGTVLGYTLGAAPYVMPERAGRSDPDAYLPQGKAL